MQKRGCAPIKLKKRKSKIKSENGLEDEPEFKIKKESPSSSSASLCLDHQYLSAQSSTVESPPNEENFLQPSANSIIKKEEDIWYTLEDGGEIKDLLPAGMIKNSSKLRFDVKEISLAEEV
jgi:hypothetical protein